MEIFAFGFEFLIILEVVLASFSFLTLFVGRKGVWEINFNYSWIECWIGWSGELVDFCLVFSWNRGNLVEFREFFDVIRRKVPERFKLFVYHR